MSNVTFVAEWMNTVKIVKNFILHKTYRPHLT